MTLRSLSHAPLDDTAAPWLLVALHGWGANAEDLAGLAPYLRLPKFAMIFPDAPLPHPQVPGGRMWYGFPFGYDFRSPPDFTAQDDLQSSRQQLQDWLLALEQTTEIPLQRTVLAGFSQGGAMTLDVGSQLPLAGQIILSGYLHGPLTPPVAPRPMLVVHGIHDPVVPVQLAQVTVNALEAVGQSVDYVELPMGHEILPEIIQKITDFCEDLRLQGSGIAP